MTRSRSRIDRRRRSRRAAVIAVVAAVLLVAAFPLWSPWLACASAECILRWSAGYTVREITVRGNSAIPDSVIIAAAQIAPAASLFRLPLPAIEARVRAHPWLKSVCVRRRLPDTVEIRVTERTPAAILRGDSLRLLTTDSVIVPPLTASPLWELPLLTPPRTIADRAGTVPRDSQVLALLHELLTARSVSEAAWKNVSEIYYLHGEMRATLVEPPVELLLGRGADALNWHGVIRLLDNRQAVTAATRSIDLRIPGRLIAAGDPVQAEERRNG